MADKKVDDGAKALMEGMAVDMTEGTAAFQRQMLQLASFARSPDRASLPEGLAPERAQIYRQLFLNNIAELLASTLPVTRAQVPEPVWRHWVSSFYSQYPHSTPYFMEIAGEFVEYLNGEREGHDDELPAWRELAHYEWVQLAISVDAGNVDTGSFDAVEMGFDAARDADACAAIANTPSTMSNPPAAMANPPAAMANPHTANAGPWCPPDWGAVVPVLSPVSAVLAYEYPVHEVANLHAPVTTLILVYRDNADQVQRMLLSPLAAQLLDAIRNNEGSLTHAVLERVAECSGQPVSAELQGWALQLLDELALRGVLWCAVP